MGKKGTWNTAYKKRWMKLWSNKKLAFEVTTKERVWCFLNQTESVRNHWFDTIQSVCTNVPLQRAAQPQPMQQQVRYVAAQPMQQPQAQPQQQQVRYVQAPAQPMQGQFVAAQPMANPNVAMMNGNVPYAVQPQPQQPQPVQTQYRGSVDQGKGKGGGAQLQPHLTRPASQSLQPGMVGYNGGDMYNGGQAQAQSAVQQQKWEDEAPPAYAVPSAPRAPLEADIAPSAPPMDDENENEGGFTGQ